MVEYKEAKIVVISEDVKNEKCPKYLVEILNEINFWFFFKIVLNKMQKTKSKRKAK